MSIIDVSVHLDTHKVLRSRQHRSTRVCALMPTQPCVHAHKHTVTRTTTHLCLQMESHSSLDHLQWGAEALFPFRCFFIHSFIHLLQQLCSHSPFVPTLVLGTVVAEMDRSEAQGEGTAALDWGLGTQQARG